MIYLIEGPDGVGKTTLARNIVNKAITDRKTCLFFHCTNKSERKSAEEDYTEVLANLKKWNKLGYDVVLDRAWISNIVYTTIYEPDKEHVSEELAEKLAKVVDKIIICLPKNKNKYLMHFDKLSKERKEDYTDNVSKVYDLFNSFANKYTRYDMFNHITDKPEEIDINSIND